jgi:F-type H+-transporting ATPase subunit gamma
MQQLTRAMKMVSAAKLKRAQDRVVSARPYASTMVRVFERLASRAGEYEHPLLTVRGDEHYVVALITADKGLCGAFNTNLIKAAQQFIRESKGKPVEVVPIGKKGRDLFRRRGVPMPLEYVNITGRSFNHADGAVIARELMDIFTEEGSTIDKVFLIYSEFKSVLSQRVTIKQLLPIAGAPSETAGDRAETSDESSAADHPKVLVDYIYEQPPSAIFGRLLPRYVETLVYHALLESVASEHAARMTAMDAASKNAGDVISNLTLNMNRVRQASITREIIEVVSGAQALG